jgi:5-methylcytosine-specific restriction endonuclease McrA
MPKDTPSMAKNKIKRSLSAICDPYPSKTEENLLWEYFESCCAYCGNFIERDSRTGHLDHLVPIAEGGGNNIHNHALSCARCNGDEKREELWESFLEHKAETPKLLNVRRAKIESWLSLTPGNMRDENLKREADSIVEEALGNFEKSVLKMRELRGRRT